MFHVNLTRGERVLLVILYFSPISGHRARRVAGRRVFGTLQRVGKVSCTLNIEIRREYF